MYNFSIPERTFKFGVRIVNLVSGLPKNSAGFAISNQLIRSGTSIGANVEEAQNAGSRKEFIRSITIALKEARETLYWLKLIAESKIITLDLSAVASENLEIIKILTSSIKSAKKKL
jgi:four helix bundle protein